MKRYGYISLVLTFALVGCKQKPDMSVTYPETYRSDSVLVFFGDTVVHPYSWLEAVQSDTTKAWLAVQDSLTSDYLSKIPFRAKIRKDLDSVDAYPRRQQMEKHGYAYYLFENIDSCYNLYEMDSLGNKLRFLLDINTLSKADSAMILNFRLSDNGRYLAYLFSTPKDSSGNNIRIRDVELNQDLPETIDSVQYTWIAWKDNQLYYTFFDKDSKKWGIFCHQPNSLQDADSMFLHHYCINASFSEDKRFLYLIDNSYFCIKPMDKPNSNLVYVFEKENIDGLDNIQNIGDDIYLLAYQDKYMKLNINSGKPQWDTIFSAGKGDFLSWACIVDDKIVASHLHNSYSRLYVYDMDGSNQTELPLPCIGTVRSSLIDNTTFYYDFSSFAVPSTLYRIQDIHRLEAQVFKVDNPNVRSEDFITEQIWCTSKDSTRVPFFITYKKNMQRNGTNPILLYGYGGFNNIMYPSFSPLFYSFFEKGGIFVRASLRGDGGFGKEWYEAGIKENKQNTFDDFIAVAEYLIRENYTSPEKLAIMGGSNGGLLVGACMTQRPDLFKVAIPDCGVLDMLDGTERWFRDYGSIDKEEDFRYMIQYSPLQNVKFQTNYPATLITVGMKDKTVPPEHSYKFAATMQYAQASENPILLRADPEAGHTGIEVDKFVDILSFLFWNLGMEY